MRRGLGVLLAALLGSLGLAGTASAEQVDSAIGIPCTERADGVQACQGDLGHRVKTWDGVPLDATVWLPPADQDGPFPLIVYLHGWGFTKDIAMARSELAKEGYAIMAYTARGFGFSCGLPVSRGDPGCGKGWIHLADARYEARDTQHLAGLLADEGLVKPKRVGVTGASYGGGQSYLLAALKNRVMKPNGRLATWRSPDGKEMKIAAAAPEIGWTDLAYALVPNGRTIDYANYSYGPRVGVPKLSWLAALYGIASATGFYAPAGQDPSADITSWFALILSGNENDPGIATLIDQITSYHSAYYLERGLPDSQRRKPAPILAYNAWTDDLFPAPEPLRYRRKLRQRYGSEAEFSLLLADGFGHGRASLTGTVPGFDQLTDDFFARHLKGASGQPLGVRTLTQGCNGQEAEGPFTTGGWGAQHPGEVRLADPAPRSVSSTGGLLLTGIAVDPVIGASSCRSAPAYDDPGAASYTLPAATGDGYTLLGSPTVIARLDQSDPGAQLAARLWDVAPGGSQTLASRTLYRPSVDRNGKRQVFQLHANGWHLLAGHSFKLELLGVDAPFGRPSNASFTVAVSDLELRLPVREQPGTGAAKTPLPSFPVRY